MFRPPWSFLSGLTLILCSISGTAKVPLNWEYSSAAVLPKASLPRGDAPSLAEQPLCSRCVTVSALGRSWAAGGRLWRGRDATAVSEVAALCAERCQPLSLPSPSFGSGTRTAQTEEVGTRQEGSCPEPQPKPRPG